MALEKLFDKCPVLPVDASISVARYLRSIRQTLRQAVESESEDDIERTALLQIRALQLICKTLPSHPEYELAENRSVVKELRGIAHTSFLNIERLASLLGEDNGGHHKSYAGPAARRRVRAHHVEISASVVNLFETIAAENTSKGLNTIGIVAGRLESQQNTESGSRKQRDDAPGTWRITALVIPSQTALSDRNNIRYEADVTDLLGKKGFVHMGFIQMCPNQSRLALSPISARTLARYQKRQPDAVGIVIAPQDPLRVEAFSVTEEHGLNYVLGCAERELTPADEVIPRGEPGEGRPIWSPVKNLEIRKDGEPLFKLYDLRPLAVARDEHERSAKRLAK